MTRHHASPRARLLAALLFASLAACAAPARSATTVAPPAPAGSTAEPAGPRGYLFIVGGGPRPEAMTRRFVDLAGGPGKARIVVFPMASADTSAGSYGAEALRKLGADAFHLTIGREEAMRDSVARLLDGVTGVCFGGGDQSRLTAALGGTPVEAAIHRLYANGAVIGGTSAG